VRTKTEREEIAMVGTVVNMIAVIVIMRAIVPLGEASVAVQKKVMRIETLFLVPGQRATRLHRRELGKFDDNSWLFCWFLTSLHLNVHCSIIVLLSLLNTDGVAEEIQQ
jgi:hypothetical protein